jgi:hypothetical protein
VGCIVDVGFKALLITAAEPNILLKKELDAVEVGESVMLADVKLWLVVVMGCVFALLPESIFCEITLPFLSTVTVLVIIAGTLI